LNENEEDQTVEGGGASTEKSGLAQETDPVKKAIGLGALVMGVYLMDRLLGEEEVVTTKDGRQVKINKTFIDEILE